MKIPPFKELNAPDSLGYWSNKKTGEKYGGQYISPLLIPNLKKVEAGFKKAMKNKKFLSNLEEQLVNHIGIVTPILRSRELEDIAGGEKKCNYIKDNLGFDNSIDYKKGNVIKEIKKKCPNGIDVYFDNVGGEILDAALIFLRRNARVILCGAISQYNNKESIINSNLK